MDKSYRTRLKHKNTVDIRENKYMVVCRKCKRYNTVINTCDLYIHCIYCGNPNFIHK